MNSKEKASVALVKIGKTPAECGLILNEKAIQGVVEIKLSLDIENGPILRYITTNGVYEEVHDVDFGAVIEDITREELLKIEEQQRRILRVGKQW